MRARIGGERNMVTLWVRCRVVMILFCFSDGHRPWRHLTGEIDEDNARCREVPVRPKPDSDLYRFSMGDVATGIYFQPCVPERPQLVSVSVGVGFVRFCEQMSVISVGGECNVKCARLGPRHLQGTSGTHHVFAHSKSRPIGLATPS